MKWLSSLSSLIPAALLSACAAATEEQGRYIVYLEPGMASRAQSSDAQATLLAGWSETLQGNVRLERVLATGGWVITVVSPGDADRQMRAIGQLPGIEDVERDALMRHQ